MEEKETLKCDLGRMSMKIKQILARIIYDLKYKYRKKREEK